MGIRWDNRGEAGFAIMSRNCYLGRVGLSDSGVGIRIRCHKGVWTVRFAACSYSDHCHRTTASLLLLLLPRSVAIETAAAHDDDEQHALSKVNRLERPSTDSDLRPRAVRASCPQLTSAIAISHLTTSHHISSIHIPVGRRTRIPRIGRFRRAPLDRVASAPPPRTPEL